MIDSKILFEELMDNFSLIYSDLWLELREYESETVSFAITDLLERFPNPWEVISLDVKIPNGTDSFTKKKLNLKVLGITDGRIDRVEVNLV